jgi:hypothetical protein
MMKFVKEMGEGKVTHVPPDLDLKPYIDEHDTEILEQMRVLIKAAKARHAAKASTSAKRAKKAKLAKKSS